MIHHLSSLTNVAILGYTQPLSFRHLFFFKKPVKESHLRAGLISFFTEWNNGTVPPLPARRMSKIS